MQNQISTYFYIAELEPSESCNNFNPGELCLGNGWILDIYLNLICIWNPDVSESFKKNKPFVKEALDLAVSLFMFRSKLKISYQLKNWIEAKEIRHGDISGSALQNARNNRNNTLDISREVLTRAFKKYFNGYL